MNSHIVNCLEPRPKPSASRDCSTGQSIHGFFCRHRGNQFASTALILPMTERFTADIRHYIDTRRLDLVRFAKGQSKDKVAQGYLAGRSGSGQILFAGQIYLNGHEYAKRQCLKVLWLRAEQGKQPR